MTTTPEADEGTAPNKKRKICNGNGEKQTVLVTGGAGYIGSHTCLELLNEPESHYEIVIIDNFENSTEESIRRVQEMADGDGETRLHFRKCDIRDKNGILAVFEEFPNISSCIHFAGLKALAESIKKPLMYYDYNISGTRTLLEVLNEKNVKKVVFSSSASVYGSPEMLPLVETAKLRVTNPYGRTKLFIEEILTDLYSSDNNWKIIILRYFNVIGAHSSGRIGEDPPDVPNNVMPFISQVASGRRDKLNIFGKDWDTSDGSGVRDFIHVTDLAKAHVAAVKKAFSSTTTSKESEGFCEAVNVGTGHGISVLELVEGMKKASGKPIPYEFVDRRPGDLGCVYADPSKAKEFLNWKAELTVDDMCRDQWKWESSNPNGYNNDKES